MLVVQGNHPGMGEGKDPKLKGHIQPGYILASSEPCIGHPPPEMSFKSRSRSEQEDWEIK